MPRKSDKNDKARANGQGSIWKDGRSGKFRWQYRDAKGNILASGTTTTEAEAENALLLVRADDLRGMLATPERITVKEYADRWLRRREGLEKTTKSSYRRELNLALEHIGSLRLKDIRAFHLREMLLAVSERKGTRGLGRKKETASRTLAYVLTRVRAVLREAVSDSLIPTDPTLGVKRIKVSRTEHPGIALDFHEVDRLYEIGTALHQAGLCRLWPALFIALSVGLRRGEVMGLTWAHVDLEAQVIKVRQNLIKLDKGIELKKSPKTDAGNRDIPFLDSLKHLLTEHKLHMQQERAKLRAPWLETLPVFPSLEGQWTHPDTMHRSLESVLAWSNPEGSDRRWIKIPVPHRPNLMQITNSGAKLPTISPHDLRHTCGTLWLRQDPAMPIEVVSKLLGHADIVTTLRIYRHVHEVEKRQHMIDRFNIPKPSPTISPDLN